MKSQNDEYRTNCQLDIGNMSLICDITMLDRVGVFHKPPHSKRSVHLPTVPGQDLHLPTASMVCFGLCRFYLEHLLHMHDQFKLSDAILFYLDALVDRIKI